MLAGELRNSNSTSPDYLKPIWPRMVAMHVNTVLSAVQWEVVEPQEGKFDFSLVDTQIRDAQSYNLRLIFLWFGSWKNGVSSYVPAWVKTNQTRFPRVAGQGRQGQRDPVHIERREPRCRCAALLPPSCGTSSKWTPVAGSS